MGAPAHTHVRLHLRLYIADNDRESRKAQENLNKICSLYLQGQFELKIFDVTKEYQAALDEKIFLTPTLIIKSERESLTIFGDLSDQEKLLEMMIAPSAIKKP